jgi:hypothetical protein
LSVDPGPIEPGKTRSRGKAEYESARPYAEQTSAQTKEPTANYRYTRAFFNGVRASHLRETNLNIPPEGGTPNWGTAYA